MEQARHMVNIWIAANKVGDNGRALPVEKEDDWD